MATAAAAASHNSPCAACKFLRRKCTEECVFAPYFPPEQPSKFATVHRVFGASNVAKILNELPGGDREDAVASLFYEADARLRDPVYGCVGYIAHLQQQLKALHFNIDAARQELAAHYIAPNFNNPNPNPTAFHPNPAGSGSNPEQFHNLLQMYEAQQAASSQQEMIRAAYNQQLQLQVIEQQSQQETICRLMDAGGGTVSPAPISLATGRDVDGGGGIGTVSSDLGANVEYHHQDDGRFQLFLPPPEQGKAEDEKGA